MESPSDIAALQTRRFILQQMIGEGSYAKVYKSIYLIDETRSIELACKVVDCSSAPRMYLTKFLPRELDILIRVNHPHIIQVTNIYQRQAKYFIFMRLGENGDLLTFISKNGALSEAQSRMWMRQLICGLEYMHALNIAHRDLKCENVLISSNFNVKLTDFGFARRTRTSNSPEVLSETFCGSLLYAAPEILKGIPYQPKMADIWSMGIILYTMLNRALPFNETSVRVLYDKQIQHKWKFRSNIVNELSSECKKQVSAMMEPDATLRPTATAIFNGPWIKMDPKLTKLSQLEETLLRQATKDLEKPWRLEDCGEADAKDGVKTLKPFDARAVAGYGSGPFPS